MKAKDLNYLTEAYSCLVNSANNKNFWPRYFTFHKLGANFNKDLGNLGINWVDLSRISVLDRSSVCQLFVSLSSSNVTQLNITKF